MLKTRQPSSQALLLLFVWLAVSLSFLIAVDIPYRFDWPPTIQHLNALHALPLLTGFLIWRLHRTLSSGVIENLEKLSIFTSTSIYLLGCTYVFPFEIDDSYITMLYAKNLLAGHGLVFSPGDVPLEGYTNFSLVLIEAAFQFIGLKELWPIKLLLIGVGIALLMVTHKYLWTRCGLQQPEVPFVATFLIATSSPFILWTVGGLETVLFTAAVTIAYTLYAWAELETARSRTRKLATGDLLLAFAVLTRPEGALFFALGLGYRWISWLLGRKRTDSAIGYSFAALSVVVLYAAWKFYYFGSLLPSTYLAKTSKIFYIQTPFLGIERFAHFLTLNHHGVILSGLIVMGLATFHRQRHFVSAANLITVALVSFVVYLWSLGYGVSMDLAYRLYVPIIPLAALLLADRYLTLEVVLPNQSRLLVTSLLFGFLLIGRFADLASAWNINYDWNAKRVGGAARQIPEKMLTGHKPAGKWLGEKVPASESIVLHDAGIIPYYSNAKIIDTFSLTDLNIIQMKRSLRASTSSTEASDYQKRIQEYVLAKKPLIILQDREGLIEASGGAYKPLGIEWHYNYPITPWIRSECESNLFFTAVQLSNDHRKLHKGRLRARTGDKPGNLVKFDLSLEPGRYEAAIRYTAARGKDQRIGVWQIVDAQGAPVSERHWLKATGRQADIVRAELNITAESLQPLQARLWHIDGEILVDSTQFKPTDRELCLKYY